MRAYSREYYAANKERIDAYPSKKAAGRRHVLKKHGISEEEYQAKFEEQSGVCAICLHPPKKKRLHIDHDHKTNLNRGLLCWKCNLGLGLWNDNRERYLRAVEYLDKYKKIL